MKELEEKDYELRKDGFRYIAIVSAPISVLYKIFPQPKNEKGNPFYIRLLFYEKDKLQKLMESLAPLDEWEEKEPKEI